MRRGLRWAAAFAASLIAAFAAVALAQDNLIVLTTEAPEAASPLSLQPRAERETLRVRVLDIRNPNLAPFGVVVATSAGRVIGRFAVYPPDQTGNYSVAAPEWFNDADPPETLILRLDPFSAKGAEGLEVTLVVEPKPSGRTGSE